MLCWQWQDTRKCTSVSIQSYVHTIWLIFIRLQILVSINAFPIFGWYLYVHTNWLIFAICRFVLNVNDDERTTTINANDGYWHHICVIWTSNRGSWKIYMDGLPNDSGNNLANGQTIKGTMLARTWYWGAFP